MLVNGTEEFIGKNKNPFTIKQQIILDIIGIYESHKYMHNHFRRYGYTSKVAYYFIKRYKDELNERVKTVFCQKNNFEIEIYELYIDVYVDLEYCFTVRNFYRNAINAYFYNPQETEPYFYYIYFNEQDSSYSYNDISFDFIR